MELSPTQKEIVEVILETVLLNVNTQVYPDNEGALKFGCKDLHGSMSFNEFVENVVDSVKNNI